MNLVLSLPTSTAECERGFSIMKQIKCDWRSSLGTEAINNLMTIVLLSPTIQDFEPRQAIELWLTSGLRQRRPTFMDMEVEELPSEDILVDL